MLSRRGFVGAAGLVGLSLGDRPRTPPRPQDPLPPLRRPAGPPAQVARDESYWARVAAYYRVSSEFTNLEAGYYGMMAQPVLAEYHRQTDRVNLASSHFARRRYDGELEPVRARMAALVGAKPTEIAFTRNATEALQCLIGGYNRLRPGDVVLYADLDYMAMQYAMNWLADRRGVRVERLVIPEPVTRETLLETYRAGLAAHPGAKLLLLTHLNNKTGLITPTREVAAMARARGVDVIVDAAHSFGQTTVTLADLGADFVGINAHKWLGAPIGVGVMYIKAERLGDIDRMMADESASATSIASRVHTGTSNFAAYLTVPAALDFHEAVGPAYKAARLRYLRDRWVGAARGTPGLDILTPDDPDLVAAITSFRLGARKTRAELQPIVESLLNKYGLFTVWRNGLARGDCIRVTPALYNTPEHADRLAAALTELATGG